MRLIITQVNNGYIVRREEQESVYERVYQFREDLEQAEAHALYDLLWDHFEGCFQSKHKGGLVMTVEEGGKD